MPTADDVRLAAVNIGVRSKEELDTAAAFWEAVLETTLEDWNEQGRSRQARVGQDAHAFFFNLRIRKEIEPHFGHRAAFGIAVTDLDGVLSLGRWTPARWSTTRQPRARSCHDTRLIHDPVGNRAVIWQR